MALHEGAVTGLGRSRTIISIPAWRRPREISQRGFVGVAGADILYVEDDGVQRFQNIGGGLRAASVLP
jgi:hypothetical protein